MPRDIFKPSGLTHVRGNRNSSTLVIYSVWHIGSLFCRLNFQVHFIQRILVRFPSNVTKHDDVIKWKHFPYYWLCAQGIHQSRVNSPHKGQWCGALMFSLIYARTNGKTNNRDASGLRRNRTHYDVTVMISSLKSKWQLVSKQQAFIWSSDDSLHWQRMGWLGYKELIWTNGVSWGKNTFSNVPL